MNWKWTDHIKQQLNEREIPEELINDALTLPDKIVDGKMERKIYQKIIGNKLIRVVTERDVLITVYCTDKIKKYMGGQ